MNRTATIASAVIISATALTAIQAQNQDTSTKTRFEQMNTDASPDVSREEYAQYWKNTASAFDTNKDGTITKNEMKAAAKMQIVSRDLNKDSLLTQEELLGSKTDKKGEPGKSPKFNDVDKDKNGKLSPEEVNSAGADWFADMDTNKDGKTEAKEAEEVIAVRYSKMDTNKDGVVSVEEFTIFFK